MRTGAGAPTVGLLAVVLLAGMSLPAESADLQLKEAIRSGDHAAVRALIEQGADVNAPEADGATVLHWAVRWDDPESVDLLLGAGAGRRRRQRLRRHAPVACLHQP